MDAFAFALLGLAMLAGCLVVFAFVGGAGKRRLAKRAKRLRASDREEPRPSTGPQLRLENHGGLDGLIHRIMPRPAVLRARLAASGTGMSIGRYGVACLVVAIVLTGFLAVRGIPIFGAILLGLLGGLWLPHAAVGWLVKRRQTRFAKLFPEAIGLMVRGLKAGLPVAETMIVIAREVANPVGEEFRKASDQIRLGQPIEEAMWAVARRLNLPEFNFLVITLSVQRETGGNLAETLENLDDILRKRQQMKLKIKAMSSEATASAGIIGSLPFVMSALLFLVSHDYVMLLFTNGLGRVLAAGGAASMAMGVFVMARMVRFEI